MKKWYPLVLTGVILCAGCTGSRTVSSRKTVTTSYESCLQLYKKGETQKTVKCLEEIPEDLRDFGYFDLKGTLEAESSNYAAASKSFTTSTQLDSNRENTFVYFKLGMALWKNHNYLKAGKAFKEFSSFITNPKPSIKNQISYFIRSDSIAQDLYENPKSFNPVKLRDSVNTPNDELGITMTLDHSLRILTRRDSQEDLLESKKENKTWTPPSPVSSINTPYNEGAPALSGDGQTLVFTGCNYPRTQDGMGSCDIFISQRTGNGWSAPIPMNAINSIFWDSQPTLSANGTAIIFSSERKGGYGKKDLWISVQDPHGEWTTPMNLGSQINTPGNEENPFLHIDERTLYFTSDYHPGFGGRDIFFTQRLHGNNWTRPKNLGYPINSFENEEGIYVDASGTSGYFSSAKDGNFDLYAFTMDSTNKPAGVMMYEIVLKEKQSGSQIENAKIQIVELNTGKTLNQSFTNEKGIVRFLIQKDSSYSLNIKKESYHFMSKNINAKTFIYPGFRDTFYLNKIEAGQEAVILENIFFATASADLQPESDYELINLANFLLENPQINIHIMGHTDDVGSEEANLKLSQSRALAVKEFLINRGVPGERIRATGYGESKPIADNTTPEGRAKNRRTEFTIE